MALNTTQPTYKRQRFLLEYIRQLEGEVTSTDLQKLVFLYTMDYDSEFYDFIPYKYGAYSFQLAEDIDILRRDGYISAEVAHIQATGPLSTQAIYSVASERGINLIRRTYQEYPYYAINSKIINRILVGAEKKRVKSVKESLNKPLQSLFTIGYEGKNIESFMNTLIMNNISLLCDVRKNPLSRKFGFSKRKLEHIATVIGIKYVHIPTLGIETEKRSTLDTVDDYKYLFDNYTEALSNHQDELENLYAQIHINNRVALMCYEKDPNMCHRHILRDYLVSKYSIRSVDL